MVFFHSKNQRKLVTIGIASVAPGLGSTHLCIALANYLASKKGLKTACLEIAKSCSFKQLQHNCKPALFPGKNSAHQSFRIYDVDYYPNISKSDIPSLSNLGYDALILDFGFPTDSSVDEFYRCNKKLLISSAACWKRYELSAFFEAYPQIKTLESLSFMIRFGTISDMLKIGKTYTLPFHQLHSIPFLLNPFHIGKEHFSFFEKLI